MTTQPIAYPEDRDLIKFLFFSTFCLMVGTIHGVWQIQPPVREWLDSIGSPYGGPGHMIDPLAHAHMNLIGGVVTLCMAATYYMLPKIAGVALWSRRLVFHTFWWTAVGLLGFYTTLMTFGTLEGNLLLAGDLEGMDAMHQLYKPVIATIATVMGVGFWVFFFNVFATIRAAYKKS